MILSDTVRSRSLHETTLYSAMHQHRHYHTGTSAANSLNTHHTLYVKNLCSKELIHAAWEQISPQLMLIASHLAELDTR